MPRHYAIGNGNFLINLDDHSFIRDIYYPFVGQLNHVGGYQCRVGMWVDSRFAWLSDPEWSFQHAYEEDSLITNLRASHNGLGISLTINDGVHQRESIYIKRIVIKNELETEREVRFFFQQDMMINETEVGDTAAYYPSNNTVFHYKKDRYFMFSGTTGTEGIYQYTTGVKRFHGAEGTWRDAEDGVLSGNGISQGSVDSTISFRLTVPAGGEATLYYWMSVGKTLEDVKKLDKYVKDSQPGKLLDRVKIYWQRWVNKSERSYGDLNHDIIKMFKHSLLIVRTQTDVNGAIVAANDTDILQHNRDHYSYMWPRDGALVAYAMSMAGYSGMVAPFFKFCSDALTPDGFLHHKYNPDGTVGSSWHPYIYERNTRLPIQEDETALVLFALWQDFAKHGNIELPQALFRTLIRRAARFLSAFIEPELGLPQPSYDLWEERYGIFTFTCSAVYGGLVAASNFCSLFGDDDSSRKFLQAAMSIRSAMLEHLWDEDLGRFVRGLYLEDGQWVKDTTLESSIYGIFEFGVLPADDPCVVRTMTAIKEGLSAKTSIGGIARYYHDYYFQRSSNIEQVSGNPWIICTLWTAEWEIEMAKTLADLEKPRQTLEWVTRHSMESGILPEQLDPFDGSPVSVAPLTWSHATFILTVVKYSSKHQQLSAIKEPTVPNMQGLM
jgi:GH15 family glucan-1,4-alpha-glucosidase